MNTDERINKLLDTREKRREAANDRYLAKLEKAEQRIGELMRNGKTVYYFWPPGGKCREGDYAELISFIIRNRYV